MSQDPNLFKPPASYPEPPKDLWYEIPKATPVDEPPKPIFPWESNAPKATRVFPDDPPKASATGGLENAEEEDEESDEKEEGQAESSPQSLSAARISSPDPWSGYSATNAWDEIPQIQHFIKSVASRRFARLQLVQGGSGAEEVLSPGEFRLSTKLTDFPSELERPSLPVTPAPVRGPKFWGVERDEDGPFPAAQGVPKQEDWVCSRGSDFCSCDSLCLTIVRLN
jgi:glycogenin glucosyltransferase